MKVITTVIVVGIACGLSACGDARPTEDVAAQTNPLYLVAPKWTQAIPVCWDPVVSPDDPNFATFLTPGSSEWLPHASFTHKAVIDAWQRPGKMTFTNWWPCPWANQAERDAWQTSHQSGPNAEAIVAVKMYEGNAGASSAQAGFRYGIRNVTLVDVWRPDFRGVVLHEFGHVLGFDDEMARPDFGFQPGCPPWGVNNGGNTLATPPDKQSIMAATGYCSNRINLSFWDSYGSRHAYGWPDRYKMAFTNDFNTAWQNTLAFDSGDWAVGYYKIHCATHDAFLGISRYTHGPTHGAACSAFGGDIASFMMAPPQWSDVFDFQNTSIIPRGVDWDVGYYKGECPVNAAITGMAITQDIQLAKIVCTQLSAAVEDSSCYTRIVDGSNQGFTGWDWDVGFNKTQCNLGDYMVGVSRTIDGGAPHAIRCCSWACTNQVGETC